MPRLYINAKDNKTNETFGHNCQKNIHPVHRVPHGGEDHGYQRRNNQWRDKLTDERPDASPEGHPVHPPVALREIDGERDYHAARHRRERSEMENSEQYARHVERGGEHSAHEQASRVVRRLKDGAGGGEYNLNPYGERQDPEHGDGRQPLIAENNQRHLLRREEKQRAERQADKGEEPDDTLVGTRQSGPVVLEIAEDGVHHGRDYLRDILQGQRHQAVGFLVIAQVGHTHVFANQQFVEVTAEIVDDVE